MIVALKTSTSILILGALRGCAGSWVDPDTKEEFKTIKAHTVGDDREYQLVFSDEFEVNGRTFGDGDDPRWTALNKNDYTNKALHFYSPENVGTSNGVLNITTIHKTNPYKAFNEKKKKYYVDEKHIQSGMVQGWNKFCITGGIIEFSAKLPGDPHIGGLWPALWLLGNLARGTYVGSSDYIWPFSYNVCDENTEKSQLINACQKVAHYGIEPGRGRGSPEIDVLEAMMGDPGPLPHTPIERPYFSTSLQVSPGMTENRPVLGQQPKKGHWYQGLEYGNVTKASLNPFFYGVTLEHEPKSYTYQSDAISANTHINASYFDRQRKYRVEWEPPERNGTGGYLKWYLEGHFVFGIKGDSLDLMGTEIPSEPMYLLMNTAVASSWGFPECPSGCDCDCFECGNPDCSCGLPTDFCSNIPASFEIDYIRVWQAVDEPKHVLGCSTKERPSERYILGNKKKFMAEGDKEPLQPIRNGGGACRKDSHCGGSDRGTCGSRPRNKHECVCKANFTGPFCLAHNGFYDDPYIEANSAFEMQSLMFPTGMLIMGIALLIGFAATMSMSVIRKRKESSGYQTPGGGQGGYDLVSTSVGLQPGNGPTGTAPSYQQPSGSQPNQQRVVTYCMIDGRLIDE